MISTEPPGIRADAYRLLARREHSVSELVGKLLRKGYGQSDVEQVVANLQQENAVSDKRFTESFVNFRRARGQGPVKIRSELSKYGVDQAIVEECIADKCDIWHEVAIEAYAKKFGNEEVPADYQTWSKQARFLQQRGFTSEQIRKVIRQDF